MTIQWLGSDITVGALTFRHGDNGEQEFYEFKDAPADFRGGFCLGVFQTRGEKWWNAYVIDGDAKRILNAAVKRPDGIVEEEPLWRVRADIPKPLCVALEKLWREHGTGIIGLPVKIVRKRGKKKEPRRDTTPQRRRASPNSRTRVARPKK
jgi:hypothetical protein